MAYTACSWGSGQVDLTVDDTLVFNKSSVTVTVTVKILELQTLWSLTAPPVPLSIWTVRSTCALHDIFLSHVVRIAGDRCWGMLRYVHACTYTYTHTYLICAHAHVTSKNSFLRLWHIELRLRKIKKKRNQTKWLRHRGDFSCSTKIHKLSI